MARAPQVPALPPSPVYLGKHVPPKFRGVAFWPLAFVSGFLVFFLTGLLLGEFEIALVIGLIAGPVIGYAAVGPPFTRAQVARARARVPKAPPEKRPLLFFPAAIIGAALLYFLLGILITSTPLEEDLLALLALAVAIPAAIAIGGLLYGFPHPRAHFTGPLQQRWAKVPAEKRPLLFFPLALLIAAPIYVLLGFGLTEALGVDYDVLIALVVALVVGFWAARRLVGVPKATGLRQRVERLPDVPARARPLAFVAFVLLVGALFAVILGGTLGAIDFFNGDAALDLAFPLFLLAGWLLAVPLAGRLFGYPIPDRPLRAYAPKLTAEQRPALLLPMALGLGLVLMLLLGLALGAAPFDLDTAPLVALLAFPVAFLVSLRVLHVRAAQMDPRALARAPEAARPLVALALWLFVGTLLFAALGQVVTNFEVLALLSYGAGLAVALLLVDAGLLLHPMGQRRALRSKEREIEARLRAEMGLDEPAPAAAGQGRFRRRGKGKA
ncbi:MAG TPA: hypothetical protein VGR28_11255 [Candidatus Thermoplasmatota archaeon]|jgi:hypothetical protein|nr:hypothetical protein [Candidatus Thermoplasmatota archaeon]